MPLREIRAYLSAATGSSGPPEALLAAHLGDRGEDEVIPADACWRLFSEHAASVGDEMHRVFDAPLRPGGTTLLIARMLLAGRMIDALRACAETLPIMAPDIAVSVAASSGGVSLRWRCLGADGEVRRIALEATVTAYYAIFSWLAGEPLPVLRVRAPERRRASGAPLLHLMRAPVVFADEALEIVFAPEVASLPIIARPVEGWHEGAHRMICEALIRTDAHEGFSGAARSAVLDGADQQALADRWGVSTKTVARRLEQEGLSFRRIRDEARMKKSASMIHAGLTIEEIGDLLGYQDPRSFRRAFRRWFGQSPSVYRAHRLAA
jgi:AraC-like DNA-binding protein